MTDPERRDWALLTKCGGVVSILKQLTLAEARAAYERLDPFYGQTLTYYEASPDGEHPMQEAGRGSMSACDLRDVIGPEGWDASEMMTWERWPQSITVKYGTPEWDVQMERTKNYREQWAKDHPETARKWFNLK